jgi:Uma2 family endonuclease
MPEAAERLWTVDEFLAWDDGTDRRYQLLRGVATMMAPPQAGHGALVIQLGALLRAGLRRPCTAVGQAGIKPPHRNDTYYVADLAITCEPLRRGQVYLAEPVVVVEVLSPSTAATDRLLKLDDYRLIPSVTDIVFVASGEIRVEHWRRTGPVWTVALLGPGDRLELPDLGAAADLDALYAGLPLDGDTPDA